MAFSYLGRFAQSAWAHDPPEIAPTRLEFDASQAPPECNDRKSFNTILWRWVPPSTWRDDAVQRLVVRIQGSANGPKSVDVSVVDSRGSVQAERHTPYSAATECHKVLYDTAYLAAQMLGAFEPRPPQEPMTCPACAPCSSCQPARPVPPVAPSPALPRMPPRFSLGLGAFVGSGIVAKISPGALVLLDIVPSSRLSRLHIEFEGAWTSQKAESIRLHSLPLVASTCWVPSIVRFCGGIATTIVLSNQLPNHELRIFGGNFRVGTELFNPGPFSIRADVFARIVFAQQSFGPAPDGFNKSSPFAGGVSLIALWAVD
ncbi:MAG TPA: hypothetical protein PK156_20965 [Polyangium sp.]|nr:hypothetical protein [Polyangium sp.]